MEEKPILIDGVFLNMGGAITIFNRLIDGLVMQGVNFILLKDARCPKLTSEDGVPKIIILEPSFKVRHNFYKKHKNDFSKVVCMANVPPSMRLEVPVTTYFHNLTVLKIPSNFSFKRKMRFWIRRVVLMLLCKNTDSWVVQTQNSKDTLRKAIPHTQHIYQYPIFRIPDEFKDDGRKDRAGFVFVGEYSYAKGHDELLEAWKILKERGRNPLLKLTVSQESEFLNRLPSEIATGLNIKNYGFLPYMQLPNLYKSSKALIYPSRNESLGLGLIEAAEAGCDILASDHPFTYSVCMPSAVFDPTDPKSIADAVCRYLDGEQNITELTISDKLEEFLDFIKNL